MNANPKSTRNPDVTPAGAETPEMLANTFATMFHRGVERIADLQKNTLDLLNQQAVDFNNTYRRTFRAVPGMIFMDLAEETMGRMVEAQKNILDVVVKQSAHVVELSKERPGITSKTGEAMQELLTQSAERTVEVQKIVLDFAAEQNKAVAETVKRQTGVPGTPMARATESIEKNVGTIIDTQKEILDVAAKPLRAGARA